MGDPNKITGLIRTEGKTRVYQMDDGSVETREGGTVAWRNNNPGNLKFEYAGSADTTVTSRRTPEAALAAAQGRYSGVVALDQWGNAIFETEAAGRAAKAQLLTNTHGERTIPEMLERYAKDDYTGKANTGAYAARAVVPNSDGTLTPGQFVRVVLTGAVRANAIALPQRAVLDGPMGKFVYVVGKGQEITA